LKLLEKITERSHQARGVETKKKRNFDENMRATVGASELACPRKTCFDLMYPFTFDLQRHIILERGHVAETIFITSLEYYNFHVETQRSYFGEKNTLFSHMKVHPDILIEVEKMEDTGDEDIDEDIHKMKRAGKKLWLSEIKSAAAIPDTYHHYWHLQVIIQAGLIALEHGVSEEEIQIELTVVNLNNGKTRTFVFDWDEEIFQEGLEVSLIIQQFKEELIEVMMGVRDEFTVPPEEIPASYNAAICSLCEHSHRCSIFSKKEVFTIGNDLEEDLLQFLDERDRFNNAKGNFDENIRPIFEKLGISGKGTKVEGKFTPGKEVPVLNITDIPREEVVKLAAAYPDTIQINPERLRYADEIAYANLAKSYGTTKMTKQKLVVKRRNK